MPPKLFLSVENFMIPQTKHRIDVYFSLQLHLKAFCISYMYFLRVCVGKGVFNFPFSVSHIHNNMRNAIGSFHEFWILGVPFGS